MTDIKDKCEKLAAARDECADALVKVYKGESQLPLGAVESVAGNRTTAAILRALPNLLNVAEAGRQYAEEYVADHGGIDGCDMQDRLCYENMVQVLETMQKTISDPPMPSPRKVSVDDLSDAFWSEAHLGDDGAIFGLNAALRCVARACGCEPEEGE